MSEVFKPCQYCGWHQGNCLKQVEALESALREAVAALEGFKGDAVGLWCYDPHPSQCDHIHEKVPAVLKRIEAALANSKSVLSDDKGERSDK